MSFTSISERIMFIKLNSTPVQLNLIQVYDPTVDKPDEKVEGIYAALAELLKNIEK